MAVDSCITQNGVRPEAGLSRRGYLSAGSPVRYTQIPALDANQEPPAACPRSEELVDVLPTSIGIVF